MEKPIGIKIAVACEILILLLMLAIFWSMNSELEAAKTMMAGADDVTLGNITISATGVEDIYNVMYAIAYITLFVGLLHTIPAYLLWKGNKIGIYAATLLPLLDILIAWWIVVMSLPVIYLIWFDKKTKGHFSS